MKIYNISVANLGQKRIIQQQSTNCNTITYISAVPQPRPVLANTISFRCPFPDSENSNLQLQPLSTKTNRNTKDMKSLVLSVLCLATLLVATTVAQQPRQYTDKFDNINVDQVLSNDRILSNYIRCLLDKGPCTQEGRELKSE